ncbi:hypothetical protein HWD35_21035 [Tsukamurella tyrosinosolvens]|uniref:hypothetical protein n=1 Tax=Tsukamurella tyrosinosolvens TaxID=57704 RepID=UPI001CE099B3|nr:hypothetical protein [Tsukamurella tyrosinosolvens]MCA4997212.1 hypothetical protein [Tsukamurella tyrosinosolvens]
MSTDELGRLIQVLNSADPADYDAARLAVADEIRSKFPPGTKVPVEAFDRMLGAAGLVDKELHVAPIAALVNRD